jgi:hypothetical protein
MNWIAENWIMIYVIVGLLIALAGEISDAVDFYPNPLTAGEAMVWFSACATLWPILIIVLCVQMMTKEEEGSEL